MRSAASGLPPLIGPQTSHQKGKRTKRCADRPFPAARTSAPRRQSRAPSSDSAPFPGPSPAALVLHEAQEVDQQHVLGGHRRFDEQLPQQLRYQQLLDRLAPAPKLAARQLDHVERGQRAVCSTVPHADSRPNLTCRPVSKAQRSPSASRPRRTPSIDSRGAAAGL